MRISELLHSKFRWVKGFPACTFRSVRCTQFSPNAACFSLRAALERCVYEDNKHLYNEKRGSFTDVDKFVATCFPRLLRISKILQEKFSDRITKSSPLVVQLDEFNDNPRTNYEEITQVLKEAGE